MKLTTYHAYTMAEALAAVRRDLGADAVILHTRTFKRGGVLGFWKKTVVEVTASPAAPQLPEPALPTRNAAARKAYAMTELKIDSPTTLGGTPSQDDQQRTRRLAMALAEAHARKLPPSAKDEAVISDAANSNALVCTKPPTVTSSENPTEKPQAIDQRVHNGGTPTLRPDSKPLPAARRFILASPESFAHRPAHTGPIKSAESSGNDVTQSMQDELAAIKNMVGHVIKRQSSQTSGAGSTNSLPQQLFEMYLQMLSQDISEELAERIVASVREKLDADQCEDANTVRTAVMEQLANLVPTADDPFPEIPSDGRPLTIAMVGPTGVGKTTTVAKLAAAFKLRHGRRVGLVTCDTYRVAAVEQLRTYANILGLPLQVASTPDQIPAALHALRNCQVILIDTAGRSQHDSGRLGELQEFMNAAAPHQVHLVLSSTAGERVLLNEAQAFSQIGVHRVVLTKLDEAVSFGMLISVIRQVGKQLSFVTTGQEVPDDLEPGRGSRLAELALGGRLTNATSAALQRGGVD